MRTVGQIWLNKKSTSPSPLLPSWNMPLSSLTYLNLKNKAKMNWMINSSKRKHYFPNILYQIVKLQHGLFSPHLISCWAGEQLETQIWLQILDPSSPTLLLTNMQRALSRQSVEADNIQLILGEHRQAHKSIWKILTYNVQLDCPNKIS